MYTFLAGRIPEFLKEDDKTVARLERMVYADLQLTLKFKIAVLHLISRFDLHPNNNGTFNVKFCFRSRLFLLHYLPMISL